MSIDALATYDTFTLAEWRAGRGAYAVQRLTLDSRTIDERRESRWSNPDYTGVALSCLD